MRRTSLIIAAAVVLIAVAAYALRAKPCSGSGCAPSKCAATSDCTTPDTVCVAGQCVPGECAATSDCASRSPYDVCVSGQCVPRPCNDGTCPAGASCTAAGCVAAPQPSSCTADQECNADFICINGVCAARQVPAISCTRPGDCNDSEYYCDFGSGAGMPPTAQGTCAPVPASAGAPCTATAPTGASSACAGGYVCAAGGAGGAGACTAPTMQPATCAVSSDCNGGYLCAGGLGICVPPAALGAPCDSDELGARAGTCGVGACGARYTCVQPGDSGGVCAADADCADGLWCGAGVCGAAGAAADGATCYSDSACGAASWCSGAGTPAGRLAGVCAALPGAGAACAPGARCAAGLGCFDGFCYAAAPGGNGAACSAQAPCASPYTCNLRPGGSYACGVLSGQGGSCASAYDCGEGDVQGVPMDCVGGVCMYPCDSSLDCDVGYACAPGPGAGAGAGGGAGAGAGGGAGTYCSSAGPWAVASSSASTQMGGLSTIDDVPVTLRACNGIGLGPCTFRDEAAAQAGLAAEGLGGYVLLSDAYAEKLYLPRGTAVGMSSATLANTRPVSGLNTYGWAIVRR